MTKNVFLFLATFLLLTACNGVDKILKTNDFEAKYAAAMDFYNNNSYSRAIQVFENLILYYRGKEHAEDILWYYSQALMKEGDFYTAGYQFKRFVRQYPYSDRAEEGLFLAAYCKYQESPEYSLDQTVTKDAVTEFEQYVEKYPQSPHIPEINAYLDELRGKLMRKDYEIAYGYYVIEAYHSAYVSLQDFLIEYPESPMREEATFYLLRSGYEYAINSVPERQRERLGQVVNDFEKMVATFKDSKYLEEARDIYTKTRTALSELSIDN